MPSISYQLYSSRNWDVADTFEMLAGLGITEVEGFGPYFEDPAKTKALLASHGMTMPTGHFALDLVEGSPEKAIEERQSHDHFEAPDDHAKGKYDPEWRLVDIILTHITRCEKQHRPGITYHGNSSGDGKFERMTENRNGHHQQAENDGEGNVVYPDAKLVCG